MAASAAALESAKGLIRSEVGKQLGIRHAPTLEFIHDALPENARHIEELLAQGPRADDAAVAASAAGAQYAGEADPYKKPHEDASDATGRRPDDATSDAESTRRDRRLDGVRARRRRQAGRADVARRGRPGPPAGPHPQGRPRRHARPDGHRCAAARRQQGHPAARPPRADREGLRRRRCGSAPRTTTDDAEGEVVSHGVRRGGRAVDEAAVARGARRPRRRHRAGAVVGVGDQGRRRARLRAGPGRRGRRAAGPTGHRPRAHRRRPSRAATGVLDVDVSVRCSSGTYVRAIARDLGAALGVGGHLTALRRTAVGAGGHRRGDARWPTSRRPARSPLMPLPEAARAVLPCRRRRRRGRPRRRLRPVARRPAARAPARSRVLGPDGDVPRAVRAPGTPSPRARRARWRSSSEPRMWQASDGPASRHVAGFRLVLSSGREEVRTGCVSGARSTRCRPTSAAPW